MSNLAIHPRTQQTIDRYIEHPAHALLIVGPAGSGKQALAEHIARQLLQLQAEDSLSDYAFFTAVTPEKDKTSIGIEAVRALQPLVKLKLPANSRAWRIILISDAHRLTAEAQNALLKLLEEPPEATMFLLTADSLEKLLPTIRSRVQQLALTLPAPAAMVEFFTQKGYDQAAVRQACMISGRLPGLASALLANTEHPLVSAVQTAKELLRATQFERLCRVDELAKKKDETLHVLFVLQHMAQTAIEQGAQATDGTATKRIKQWYRVQKAAYEAEQAYAVSAQAKLTLTNLMLSL